MYVGITRARKRLYLSHAEERMMYNQFNCYPESRFLEEIPARLIRHTYSSTGSYGSYRGPVPRSGLRDRYHEWDDGDIERERPSRITPQALGKPTLKIKGHDLNSIPGVSRGFAGSQARTLTDSAASKLFVPGERVRHPKFGFGRVTEIRGSGKDARIRVLFDTAGERELALTLAPIVKVGEDA